MASFSNPKINPFHGYFLCLSGMFSLAQISGINIMIEQAKRDAVISSVFGSVAFFLYGYWIYRIVRKQPPNQTFLEMLERRAGRLTAGILKLWIALYLCCELVVIHKNNVTWIKSMILPFTPIWAISLPMLLVCAYLAIKGIKPISITFAVLIPAIMILLVFMAVFTHKYRHYDLLRPFFSEGTMPILLGTVTTFRTGLIWFFLLLLSPHINGRYKWKHIALVMAMIALFYINSVIGFIASFGPYEAAKQRFPLFTQWRLVSISGFVEHLDFLSMYQWLSSSAIFISTCMFLFGRLLAAKPLGHKIAVTVFSAVLFIIIELRINDTDFLAFSRTYYYPISTISILCWTLIASIITTRRGTT
ncbi:GerAB/ArcD/ProY family transporter [Paenibacillus silvisoli]|uniref:GerAB/ArcD/ProY family transporter n=1 Tax=Paenibacillus silvisoli TaxID=3110539 RepID=UPI0028040BCB|nr:endospore germination permease [Paenibacillus silvisoli]